MDSTNLSLFIVYIFFLLAAIVMIPVGIVKMKKPDIYDKEIMGTVTYAFCILNRNNKYDCQLDVKYVVNGKEYTTKISEYNNIFRVSPGKMIRLRYKSSNPATVTNQPTNKVAGITLTIIGSIILCILIAIPILIKIYS